MITIQLDDPIITQFIKEQGIENTKKIIIEFFKEKLKESLSGSELEKAIESLKSSNITITIDDEI